MLRLIKQVIEALVGTHTRIIGYDFFSQQRKRFIRYFLSGPVNTLDVGFAGGSWSVIAARRGNNVVAVDADPSLVPLAEDFARLHGVEHRIDFKALDARRIGELGKRFDQVFCYETLEHIVDDQLVAQRIHDVLQPVGLAFISVPTLDAPLLYGDKVVEAGSHNGHEGMEHVRPGYSKARLCELLESTGLEVTLVEGYGGFLAQRFTSLMRWLEGVGISRGVSFPLLLPLLLFDSLIPAKKMSYFAIARKPESQE